VTATVRRHGELGPMLVIAGAAAARRARSRIAWRGWLNMTCRRVGFCLTFTNKAARKCCDAWRTCCRRISPPFGSTFHHIGIESYADMPSSSVTARISPFSTVKMQRTCSMRACRAGIDTKQERFPKGDVLAEIYSLA